MRTLSAVLRSELSPVHFALITSYFALTTNNVALSTLHLALILLQVAPRVLSFIIKQFSRVSPLLRGYPPAPAVAADKHRQALFDDPVIDPSLAKALLLLQLRQRQVGGDDEGPSCLVAGVDDLIGLLRGVIA